MRLYHRRLRRCVAENTLGRLAAPDCCVAQARSQGLRPLPDRNQRHLPDRPPPRDAQPHQRPNQQPEQAIQQKADADARQERNQCHDRIPIVNRQVRTAGTASQIVTEQTQLRLVAKGYAVAAANRTEVIAHEGPAPMIQVRGASMHPNAGSDKATRGNDPSGVSAAVPEGRYRRR